MTKREDHSRESRMKQNLEMKQQKSLLSLSLRASLSSRDTLMIPNDVS